MVCTHLGQTEVCQLTCPHLRNRTPSNFFCVKEQRPTQCYRKSGSIANINIHPLIHRCELRTKSDQKLSGSQEAKIEKYHDEHIGKGMPKEKQFKDQKNAF